jgi:N-acetylmuramoyl-L-alanine amidase
MKSDDWRGINDVSRRVKNGQAGTTLFIWKSDRSPNKSSVINDENMGDSSAAPIDMDSPEARIRAQLYEKKYFANSATFSKLVESEFLKAGRHSEGVQQRAEGIWVLEATGMPSVLIETGFLTNTEEERYLNSQKGQDEVVRNIVAALKKYNAYLEGKRSSQDNP